MNIRLFKFEDEFNELTNLYQKDNLPKVLMLSGEKGQGKSTLIFHLMSFFLREFDGKTGPLIQNLG